MGISNFRQLTLSVEERTADQRSGWRRRRPKGEEQLGVSTSLAHLAANLVPGKWTLGCQNHQETLLTFMESGTGWVALCTHVFRDPSKNGLEGLPSI